ncbi:efflux RND transporter periplasmic adaptor subunit [Phaeodactylibacter luteus]|uniref:efflux RND transporter periplasmic adaptor subunit n=1 Tax=Phaeodactylibacter luteus TaxID=1564516 RepID=UPI00147853D5|nr:efflux RND transporter periplasmic adaptor subunit [Phaeodactylibacter luteus]
MLVSLLPIDYLNACFTMTKKSTRALALLGAAAVIAAAILLQGRFTGQDEPAPKKETTAAPAGAAPADILPVEAMIARAAPLRDAIAVNGSTVPNEEVAITAEVPGKITRILFREGEYCKKGQVLLELDKDELQAERERLVVQRNLNGKIAERLQALYEKEGVSLQDYEVAAAEVEKVEADIALVDAQLEKRVVRAPFAGKLGLRMVSEGSYLSPGTAVVSLVSTNPIKLEFDVPEKYSTAVKPGSKIEFRLDGVEEAFTATVQAREPNINAATRTLRYKASAPNADGAILPGAFANVQVELASFDGAITVPTEAIIPEINEKKVMVARNGAATPVVVKTGIRRERDIQITEGLEPGDTVITSGILQLKPGTPITITKINP